MPSEGRHIHADILSGVLNAHWDLMIAFPPCTHLASSGARWFKEKRQDGRQAEAFRFFMALAECDIPRIAIENPVGIVSRLWRKPDQKIQPYWFGEPHRKTTCLWLKGLPPLVPTNMVEPEPDHVTKSGRRLPAWYNLPPSPDRATIRSRTFLGIADAMAAQWGGRS